MKPDARKLMKELASIQDKDRCRPFEKAFATAVAIELGIDDARAMRLLEKWEGKGWWEPGFTLRTGWLTEKGLKKAGTL
jgi:hypothetical protein